MKYLRHRSRGDSRPRLSGGAELRYFTPRQKMRRAALDWTAEGGCPHAGRGGTFPFAEVE